MRPVNSSISIARSCNLEEVANLPDLLLIRSISIEARSERTRSALFDSACVWELIGGDEDQVTFDCQGKELRLSLRSDESQVQFVSETRHRAVVIDITGFEHAHWAWLVRAALMSEARSIGAIYCEPENYTFSESPMGGEFFALSEKIRGIEPLPGFASIVPRHGNFVFVPMLGFEGPRLSYMIEQVQPNQALTYPIVGVPGFQLEFPFYSVQGNRRVLLNEEHIWGNRRLANANCPSSVYTVLDNIRREHPEKVMKIAPIGTKPHALGAILFKLNFEDQVDIVYDNPIRKAGRTSGYSRTLFYNIGLYRKA